MHRYLEAVRTGDAVEACGLLRLPSLCDAGAVPTLQEYLVLPAEPAVDGADVPIVMDGRPGLMILAGGGSRYRIVDLIADPRAPLVFPPNVVA